MPVPLSHKKAETALRRYALTFPDAAEEFPWGERVIKVCGKIFVFLRVSEGTLRIGMKLPTSFEMALTLPRDAGCDARPHFVRRPGVRKPAAAAA